MPSQLNDSDLEGFAKAIANAARSMLEATNPAWVHLPSFSDEVTAEALNVLKVVVQHERRGSSCVHDFKGWRVHEDGRGGERVCTKCGMGAMEHTLRNDPF